MSTYRIVAKQWLDKKHGNPYFSARLYTYAGALIGHVPMQIGAGDQYLWVGLETLRAMGHDIPDVLPREVFTAASSQVACQSKVSAWGVAPC